MQQISYRKSSKGLFMGVVLYLCVSDKEPGLVFPKELHKDYYSPGSWFLPFERHLNENYIFTARNGEELQLFKLQKKANREYFVTNEIGTFDFDVVTISPKYNKYVGNSYEKGARFYQLKPKNEALFEEACLKRGFYFLGASPDDEVPLELLSPQKGFPFVKYRKKLFKFIPFKTRVKEEV